MRAIQGFPRVKTKVIFLFDDKLFSEINILTVHVKKYDFILFMAKVLVNYKHHHNKILYE